MKIPNMELIQILKFLIDLLLDDTITRNTKTRMEAKCILKGPVMQVNPISQFHTKDDSSFP